MAVCPDSEEMTQSELAPSCVKTTPAEEDTSKKHTEIMLYKTMYPIYLELKEI